MVIDYTFCRMGLAFYSGTIVGAVLLGVTYVQTFYYSIGRPANSPYDMDYHGNVVLINRIPEGFLALQVPSAWYQSVCCPRP
jgi:hypothetical protein